VYKRFDFWVDAAKFIAANPKAKLTAWLNGYTVFIPKEIKR